MQPQERTWKQGHCQGGSGLERRLGWKSNRCGRRPCSLPQPMHQDFCKLQFGPCWLCGLHLGFDPEWSWLQLQVRLEVVFGREASSFPSDHVRKMPLRVTSTQRIGKSTMLKKTFSKLWKRGWWRGRWILPMEADLKPGESLQLSTLLATVLRQPDKDKPSQEIWLLTTLNELCKACTRGPVVVYLQLTTKNRADQFSYDECDAIASAVGAFARRLTYRYRFASSSLRSACPS